jgi:hypothetical protein
LNSSFDVSPGGEDWFKARRRPYTRVPFVSVKGTKTIAHERLNLKEIL